MASPSFFLVRGFLCDNISFRYFFFFAFSMAAIKFWFLFTFKKCHSFRQIYFPLLHPESLTLVLLCRFLPELLCQTDTAAAKARAHNLKSQEKSQSQSKKQCWLVALNNQLNDSKPKLTPRKAELHEHCWSVSFTFTS